MKENFEGGENTPDLEDYALARYLNKLTKDKSMEIFEIIFDATIREETESEIIEKTKKGVTLEKSEKIKDDKSFILKKKDKDYLVTLKSRGGMFYDDGDSQTMYYNSEIYSLKSDKDIKKIKPTYGYGGLGVSYLDGAKIDKEFVKAELELSFDVDEYDGYPESWSAYISKDGEDELIEEIYKHIVKEIKSSNN